MTNATSITIRPYAPGDRDAVLNLVPRLNVGRPEWRDPDRWESAFHRWVSAAVDKASVTGDAGSGAVGQNLDSDGKDNETTREIVFVATGPCGESATEPGTGPDTGPATEPGVLGFLHVGPGSHFSGEPEAYIGELAVSETHQRQGVGRALVEAAREWAAEAGYDRVALHASAGSPEALAFYRALGFEAEGVYLTSPSG